MIRHLAPAGFTGFDRRGNNTLQPLLERTLMSVAGRIQVPRCGGLAPPCPWAVARVVGVFLFDSIGRGTAVKLASFRRDHSTHGLLSMDPNPYAVSEPELLRTLSLSWRGGCLWDHP